MYKVTDSSFVQGSLFLDDNLRAFDGYLIANNLKDDDEPHVLVLDGHASHVTLEVLEFTMNNNTGLFQLPSH